MSFARNAGADDSLFMIREFFNGKGNLHLEDVINFMTKFKSDQNHVIDLILKQCEKMDIIEKVIKIEI